MTYPLSYRCMEYRDRKHCTNRKQWKDVNRFARSLLCYPAPSSNTSTAEALPTAELGRRLSGSHET